MFAWNQSYPSAQSSNKNSSQRWTHLLSLHIKQTCNIKIHKYQIPLFEFYKAVTSTTHYSSLYLRTITRNLKAPNFSSFVPIVLSFYYLPKCRWSTPPRAITCTICIVVWSIPSLLILFDGSTGSFEEINKNSGVCQKFPLFIYYSHIC